jgi:glutamate N-acetyltransferase / amino-acid N-acetyltransferase
MFQYIKDGTITSVKGFKAAGIYCGIKKKKKDIALIYSENDCTAAGTFTLNKVKAAPLLISQEIIKNGNKVKAVLVNSGNANACTGQQGFDDAILTQKVCAEKLNISQQEVLIASTGVIGQRMPMDIMIHGINDIVPQLSESGGIEAAEAIMTTDKKIKSFAIETVVNNKVITIGGIGKGSGMIMPNMATMLGFIATDVIIEKNVLQSALYNAVSCTFNKISVDGETSTNDMVIIMANGASGVQIKENTAEYNAFAEALEALCRDMAKSIVSDGEGATKLVTVSVKNAKTKEDADLVGKSISNSPLVKTAIHGADANWGRILSSIGMSGADVDPAEVSINFNDLAILSPGYKLSLDEKAASAILSKSEFTINIDLGAGKESTTWWTCDFSEEYISINADYRS